MTAKMLSRQATKAHSESEKQKAKVKKVYPHPRDPGGHRLMHSQLSRPFNKEIMILQGFMLKTRFERNRKD